MTMQREVNVNFIDQRCPKCHSRLLTNGKYVWCSFVGVPNYPACDYGTEEKILLDDTKDQQQ